MYMLLLHTHRDFCIFGGSSHITHLLLFLFCLYLFNKIYLTLKAALIESHVLSPISRRAFPPFLISHSLKHFHGPFEERGILASFFENAGCNV